MVTFTYYDITCMALIELFKFSGEIPVFFSYNNEYRSKNLFSNIVQP